VLLADVAQVEAVVDSMIAEARHHSKETESARSSDLGAVVTHRSSFWQVLADEQGRATSIIIEPGEHFVPVSADELGALVDVLIENVFAHTPQGIGYHIRVRGMGEGRSELTIEDCGPGFGAASVVRRGASGSGSTGLGLDIVSRTAERSGGAVRTGEAAAGGARVAVAFGAEPGPIERGSEEDRSD